MKFSQCGRLLASAGQDHIVRVWVLRDAFEHFNEVRRKSQANTGRDREDSINDNRDCNAGQLQDLLFAGNQVSAISLSCRSQRSTACDVKRRVLCIKRKNLCLTYLHGTSFTSRIIGRLTEVE